VEKIIYKINIFGIPSGLSDPLSEFFILPSSEFNTKLYVETDIHVSDDLQIFFIDSNNLTDFKRDFDDTSNASLKAIFQRIWQRLYL
jgi:hypothetical protein